MNGHRDGTGIHKTLKMSRPLWLVGSNPTDGKKKVWKKFDWPLDKIEPIVYNG